MLYTITCEPGERTFGICDLLICQRVPAIRENGQWHSILFTLYPTEITMSNQKIEFSTLEDTIVEGKRQDRKKEQRAYLRMLDFGAFKKTIPTAPGRISLKSLALFGHKFYYRLKAD